ncbi:Glu/Leu/Phe/Val dehydrogenase dimerization domain-containing protein [Longimicrobium sp.]|uniref:Glu/Leu/Phe/Val dehydrogenase dimerization domain-containing protein n=1 Tax=Longimicrobium sp. TaxID=2029185 RepID=UPI002C65B725|nr:Glu/Leu/Phe/Val dehydrogenase dimerization domain-containing protein [Longimicrobium sp.]HSU17286.1 Glu/Leu/Phe/Val dehydrogenase dimerization domain-containing protein [Longimicrobium sp.]
MTTTAAPPEDAVHAATPGVWKRYGAYLRRPPQLVVEWNDAETPARGWLVINSLRGGAAGGGTRMRAGLTRREVTYLAKTMELKFSFSGPPIGGAKSGIDFDPADPRRDGVLRRWFRAVAPYLGAFYGTGGDLNVDELRDVIPCCHEAGLQHPQEGVIRGHLRPDAEGMRRAFHHLDRGVCAPVPGELGVRGTELTVADLITGYGLARSIIRLYEEQGRSVRGERVLVEGFGAVGGPCALYLAREGALIVGVSDRDKALVVPAGLDAEETEALLAARDDKDLSSADPRMLYGDARRAFGRVEAEIFVAAAASETLDEAALDALQRQGVRTIACGANTPFRETELGATSVTRHADATFSIVPDVIANCGMARAFGFLMAEAGGIEAEPVFRAVDRTITDELHETFERNQRRPTGLLGAALDLAMERVSLP